jgi:hypothetical protein
MAMLVVTALVAELVCEVVAEVVCWFVAQVMSAIDYGTTAEAVAAMVRRVKPQRLAPLPSRAPICEMGARIQESVEERERGSKGVSDEHSDRTAPQNGRSGPACSRATWRALTDG